MKIFECGPSVNERYVHKGLKTRSYVCVDPCAHNETCSEVYAKMCEHLKSKGLRFRSEDPDKFTVTVASGDTYTVAHERILLDDEDNTLVLRPSNIMRHVTSRQWYMDSLYIDETGHVIDLTGRGVRDLENMELRPQLDIFKEFNSNPDLIIRMMELYIHEGYRIGVEYQRFFNGNFFPKPVTDANGSLSNLLQKQTHNVFSFINNFNLKKYFYQSCGMELKATLNPRSDAFTSTKQKELKLAYTQQILERDENKKKELQELRSLESLKRNGVFPVGTEAPSKGILEQIHFTNGGSIQQERPKKETAKVKSGTGSSMKYFMSTPISRTTTNADLSDAYAKWLVQKDAELEERMKTVSQSETKLEF